jgi:cell division protein FtsN
LPVYNARAHLQPVKNTVAAVQRETDTLALQQKKFPALVITPSADKYFRVQVGPYADTQSATNARHDLEADGFKSIVKR